MSLRKSPRPARALLATNRANARRSTGARSAYGKRNSAWNAVRHGARTNASAGEDWLVLATGAAPPSSFWRLGLRRPDPSAPDWAVTISVWLRLRREPGQVRPSGAADDPEPDRPFGAHRAPLQQRMHTPRIHTMVSVHSTGPSRPAEAPESERTKPECDTADGACQYKSVAGELETTFSSVDEPGTQPTGPLARGRERTKPECDTADGACQHKSVAGELETTFSSVDEPGTDSTGPLARGRERTKPECDTADGACQYMSVAGELETTFSSVDEPGTQPSGPLARGRERTKPEYNRRKEGYKNMSGIGGSSGCNPSGGRQPTVIRKIRAAVGTVFTWQKWRSMMRRSTNEAGM